MCKIFLKMKILGCFISRQRIRFPPPMDENFYDIIDLNIGKEVEFYGRCFKLIDCDKFTRTFLNRCGICVPDPISLPSDPYLNMRQKEKDAIMSKKPKRMKDTRGQFLEYDKKVIVYYSEMTAEKNRQHLTTSIRKVTVNVSDYAKIEKRTSNNKLY